MGNKINIVHNKWITNQKYRDYKQQGLQTTRITKKKENKLQLKDINVTQSCVSLSDERQYSSPNP